MTLTLKKVSAVVAILVLSLLAVSIVFLGNQRLAQGLVSIDSPFLPFDDPPTGSQILCYLNQLEEVNGFPVLHPPIPIFDVGECAGPEVTECSNTVDDDGDDLVDTADPACHTDGNAGNPSSYDPTLDDESLFVPQCKDGLDNDGDGLIDTTDPGCHSDGNAGNPSSYEPTDNTEFSAPLPACMDSNDNDGDGLVDFPADPGCSSPADTSETDSGGNGSTTENTLPLCTDGVDNDGDSLVDLADPDCAGFMPKLVVIKTVINDNSGTSTVSNFSLYIGTTTSATTSVVSGATTTVAVDSWIVGEIQRSGYTATFGGDCNSSGVVVLAAGETKTCRIMNNDVAPGAPACSDGLDNDGDNKIDLQDPGCANADDNDETDPSGGNGGSGGSTTGTLIVKKVFSTGTTTPSQFAFTLNGAATTTFEADGQNNLTLTAGTYTALEVATSTYTASYQNCGAVAISVGSTTTCTITNTLAATSSTMGTLVVKKVFGSGTTTPTLFSFALNGSATTTFDADGQNDLLVATGTYSVLEVASSTYNASHNNCSGVLVAAGTTTTCVITNTLVATSTAACANGVDDDGDGKIDSADDGCHIGNNPNMPYDPSDNNESNPIYSDAPSRSGGSSGGGGGPPVGFLGTSGTPSGSSGGSGSGSPSGMGGSGVVLGTSTTATPASASCDAYLTAFIKSGRANDPEQVRRLQTVLRNFEGAQISVNGVYDGATLAAVHAFQAKYAPQILTPWGITQSTGYVYLTTRKKINEVYCRNTKQFPLTATQNAEIARVRALGNQQVSATPSAPSSGTKSPTLASSTLSQGGAGVISATSGSPQSSAATSTGSAPDTKWWMWLILLLIAAAGAGWYVWSRPPIPVP